MQTLTHNTSSNKNTLSTFTKVLTRISSVFLIFLLGLWTPSVLGKPDASNTGTTGALTPSGSIFTSHDGQIIENLEIRSKITVQHDNVTIRNCRIIAGDDYYCIQIPKSGERSGIVIEDCEFLGAEAAQVDGGNMIVRRCLFREAGGDAIKVSSNVLIEDCYITDVGTVFGKHADGIQSSGGSNVTIRGNNIDMPFDHPIYINSQCIIIQTDFNPVDNIVIDSNWINGGGFAVQVREKSHGIPTNVRVTNNAFGRDYDFGIWTFNGNPFRSCNVWADTLQLVSGQSNSKDCNYMGADTPIEQSQKPNIVPPGGYYLTPQTLTLSSPSLSAAIQYTLDGNAPLSSGVDYNAPITVESTSTVNAIATEEGHNASELITHHYTIGGPFYSDTIWRSIPIGELSGAFTVSFRANAEIFGVDAVTGLSDEPATGYSDLACIMRMATTNSFDVRNGSSYQADTLLPYIPANEYQVTIDVNTVTRRYNVHIQPNGGQRVTIASNYSFRTEQSEVESIKYINVRTLVGNHTISDVRSSEYIASPVSLIRVDN